MRTTHSSIIKWKIVAFLICFLVLLIFCGFAIYMGQTQIIIELMKIVLPSIATGIGGYWFGRNKGYTLAKNDRNDE